MKKLTDEEIEQQRLAALAEEELDKLTAKTTKELVANGDTTYADLIAKMHQHFIHINTVFAETPDIIKGQLRYYLLFPHVKSQLRLTFIPTYADVAK